MSHIEEMFQYEVLSMFPVEKHDDLNKAFKSMLKHPFVGGLMRFSPEKKAYHNLFQGYAVITKATPYDGLVDDFYRFYEEDETLEKKHLRTLEFDSLRVHIHAIHYPEDYSYEEEFAGTMEVRFFLELIA